MIGYCCFAPLRDAAKVVGVHFGDSDVTNLKGQGHKRMN